ncbi:hypothetical protein [Aliiroseovarius sp. 2305UL8-7]|uniref:hypothetical protein n=1 Tax=Aliiroseovarius conchicola TaxID=3121637 RepID=UPI0035275DE9
MNQTWVDPSKTGNISPLLSPNNSFDIEYPCVSPHGLCMMKQTLLALALIAYALPSQAACYADYKAKQDNPLKLHYGVMQLPDVACGNRAAATRQVTQRLSDGGWLLLKIQSIFDETGLAERKESAGEFFLRF